MSTSDEHIEAGQWWVSTDGSGRKLVVNGRVDNASGNDWDVTLLPSGFRIMKTTDAITRDYRITSVPQSPTPT